MNYNTLQLLCTQAACTNLSILKIWFYSRTSKIFKMITAKTWKRNFTSLQKSGHHQKCLHPTYLELDRTNFFTYYYLIKSTELPIPLTITPFTFRLSYDEMICHVNVCICGQNPMMLPFKWIRPRSYNYVVLTLESVDKILWCFHSNETSSVVLSLVAIHLVCSFNFRVCGPNPMVLPFKRNLYCATFAYCSFLRIVRKESFLWPPLRVGGLRVTRDPPLRWIQWNLHQAEPMLARHLPDTKASKSNLLSPLFL